MRCSRSLLSIVASTLLAGCTPPADDDDSAASSHSLEQISGPLSTRNAADRSGYYFLPQRSSDDLIAVVLGFHATGSSGESFVATLQSHAALNGFAIVAPDSRVSPAGDLTWEVGTEADEVTPDYNHALACLEEVRATHGLGIDTDWVLAAGYSGGASSAPYLASNEDLFTGFAVLHGGVFPGGIGSNIIPGWFSTGEDDTIRSPDHMQDQLESLEPLGFDELVLEVFPGGHGLGNEELEGLVEWWLAAR